MEAEGWRQTLPYMNHRYYRVYRGGRQIASTVATSLKVDGAGDYSVRSVDKWLNEGR